MDSRIPVSLLDNDFYKFTMQQAVIRLFPYAKSQYSFINRGHHSFPLGFSQKLREAVAAMQYLALDQEEKNYLRVNCPYLDPMYLDFLEGYRYDPAEVVITQQGDQLQVHVEGPWYRTILWEVPLLYLICELYYRLGGYTRINDEQVMGRTADKMENYRKLGVRVAEFGTRRRYSYEVQHLVLKALHAHGKGSFVGTSNVHLAMKYNTRPIGTHAHEWFMFHAARYGFKMANAMALEHWVHVYRGDLGIALADTYTTNVFLNQFDKMFSKLFDGVRHDSGDPLVFADRVIAHYRRQGIDPMSKTIVFSDALNYDKVARITQHCHGRINMSFGIGTSLSNDVGPVALNIVIKMTEACIQGEGWVPVVKLSDENGKYTGDEQMITLAKLSLGIE